jgi:hypothetical protein
MNGNQLCNSPGINILRPPPQPAALAVLRFAHFEVLALSILGGFSRFSAVFFQLRQLKSQVVAIGFLDVAAVLEEVAA